MINLNKNNIEPVRIEYTPDINETNLTITISVKAHGKYIGKIIKGLNNYKFEPIPNSAMPNCTGDTINDVKTKILFLFNWYRNVFLYT